MFSQEVLLPNFLPELCHGLLLSPYLVVGAIAPAGVGGLFEGAPFSFFGAVSRLE